MMPKSVKNFVLKAYRQNRLISNMLAALCVAAVITQVIKMLSGGALSRESLSVNFIALGFGGLAFWWIHKVLPDKLFTAKRRKFDTSVDVSKFIHEAGTISDAWQAFDSLLIAQNTQRHFLYVSTKGNWKLSYGKLSQVVLEIHAERAAKILDVALLGLTELADASLPFDEGSLKKLGSGFLLDMASSAIEERAPKGELKKSISGIVWAYLELFDLQGKSLLKVPVLLEGKQIQLDDKRMLALLKQISRLKELGKLDVLIKWKFYPPMATYKWPPYNIIQHQQLS